MSRFLPAFFVALLCGWPGASHAQQLAQPAPGGKPVERLREGTALVEAAGSFQFTGDRIAFQPEGASESLRVLENLALERVGRIIAEGRGAQTWVVSGQITEYRGANYLLLTKAVVRLPEAKSKPLEAGTDRTKNQRFRQGQTRLTTVDTPGRGARSRPEQ